MLSDWSVIDCTIRDISETGAKVELQELDPEGLLDVDDLLGHYAAELRATGQDDEAERVRALAAGGAENFLMIVPHRVQADPSISTE